MNADSLKSVASRVFGPIVVIGVLLAIWQWYAGHSGLGSDVLPSPTRVWQQGWAARQNLWTNTVPTLQATAMGFCLSLIVGITLSILIDSSHFLRQAIMPVLIISQTLPLIAIAPLMILWFGFALLPKVLIVALVTFFPITVSLVEGYASVDEAPKFCFAPWGPERYAYFGRCDGPRPCPSSLPACVSPSPMRLSRQSSPNTPALRLGLGFTCNWLRTLFAPIWYLLPSVSVQF